MTIFRLGLAASTALGLSMTAAVAGDNNEVFLEQAGQNNVASVKQDAGSLGNSQIGTAGDAATQTGDRNTLVYTDAGCCSAYGGNNDILDADQTGNDNQMRFADSNNAKNNLIQDAQQLGNDNLMTVSHNGGKSNTILSVGQTGDVNDTRINQDGTSGMIENAQITGNDNGGGSHVNWQYNWGILIQQSGANSTIRNATIEGDSNTGYYAASFDSYGTAMRINQRGEANDANAQMLGSNGNAIWIDQTGVGVGQNVADVRQGVGVASSGNEAKLVQNGDTNNGTILQNGSDNAVVATQMGTGNTLTATLNGDGNGVGAMTGVAGALADANLGDDLFQGNIFQDSGATAGGNSISYAVNGSNNLFAFAQMGAANSISGNVGTTGASNGNQVAVLQAGSGNGTSFTQNGGNNNLAVSQ